MTLGVGMMIGIPRFLTTSSSRYRILPGYGNTASPAVGLEGLPGSPGDWYEEMISPSRRVMEGGVSRRPHVG